MQTLDELNDAFALPDILSFDEPHAGMTRARIHTAHCDAELYLQGAHLTHWKPAGAEPVLFLSEQSAFAPGKAIRGGIPIIFPWFGAPASSPVHTPADAPSHGFARTGSWTLRFAALAGDDLHLSLTLDRDPSVPGMFSALQLGADFVIGSTLQIRLVVLNTAPGEGAAEAHFEEALHTYFHVGDLAGVSVEGLAGTNYLDKTENFTRKKETQTEIHFHGEIDRPYLNTSGPVTLIDQGLRRRIELHKHHSETTVVWNPAAELTSRLPDLAADAWRHFVCIEAANAAENALALKPGEAHTMSVQITVQPL